ncbi:right-handed parallel beta-helix repeat-containing protein [Alphaproteobacteria bacterium GH1-50]|uniref:Right-handed parallel beta-helix repeat-containing protein n=1 Tax=Kangsaoukella pontilimi TaxID=2691042 RepID=A0A7C9IQG2_9RHOB|nr:glycosyl hydrolase family 28-related protein [Kangsaoukella pontilimi]MXQ09110.1 right-handed parallel beta-helix repeat-containing protein [Kangsaoukella pontilimi]
MNKAITDGLVLMPPAFSDGLSAWSSEDGTPGSVTYDAVATAAAVSGDVDFAGCLELLKTESVQRVRYTGETPILPGCYLRVTARVKAVSGAFPSVRIAGWAGDAGNVAVTGLVMQGASVTLDTYGEVVEVSAIVGAGARTGVDMQWAPPVVYGHFGLDLSGPTGGVVRIDDIRIEDVTSVFHRVMMDWVDVRDYGAVGDGLTDDTGAFVAANLAAAGRGILVPEGVYALSDTVTFEYPARFVGQVTLPVDKRLILRRNFDLPSYAAAFGDEVEAFRRGLQALVAFADHESFDLGGRRIEVAAPIDVADAMGVDTWEIRRVVRNGQLNVVPGPAWDSEVVTSTASYDTAQPLVLSNVANAANVPVGALVEGTGVGREVYVTAVNAGAGTITLSQPLHGAPASQTYTFRRFRYVLDFSGFAKLSKFTLTDIELHCEGVASGILLAPAGETFHLKDCFITKPKDRGVTSHGLGCQDLQIDRCHFTSDEQAVAATERVSLALNVNANDVKLRDNRFQRFGTTMVLFGNGHLIVGNHWFQGDNVVDGPRTAGLVFTYPNVKSVITGNYIDNCFIEWTNEHDAQPDFGSEFTFGGLTVTGNIFTVNDAASHFAWIVVKPYGAGHYLQGVSVTGNAFKSLNGTTDRVEKVDASIAGLAYGSVRKVVFDGNTFNGIGQVTQNPATLQLDQVSEATVWTLDAGPWLPFGGRAREVVGIVAEGAVTNGTGTASFAAPYATPEIGAAKDQVTLTWPEAVKGRVQVTVRVDKPV